MKRLTFALLVVIAACKKPEAVGSAGSAAPVAVSAAPVAVSGDSDTFDDSLTLPTQPKRTAPQQAAIDKAVGALHTGLTAAKTVTDPAVVCKAMRPLGKAIAGLLDVPAPAGGDATAYAGERSAMIETFDNIATVCRSPVDISVEDLQQSLSAIRTHFLAFIALGA